MFYAFNFRGTRVPTKIINISGFTVNTEVHNLLLSAGVEVVSQTEA